MADLDAPFTRSNPFDFEASISDDGEAISSTLALESAMRRSVFAATCICIASVEWCCAFSLFFALHFIYSNEWHTSHMKAVLVGAAGLIAFSWPAYWVWVSSIRIKSASCEQTLSSIADVLEAQRHFWRALGILVLLAIAAIVIAAMYPSWGL